MGCMLIYHKKAIFYLTQDVSTSQLPNWLRAFLYQIFFLESCAGRKCGRFIHVVVSPIRLRHGRRSLLLTKIILSGLARHKGMGGPGQTIFNGGNDGLKDCTTVAKPHLLFGWVDVDIHFGGINLHEDDRLWILTFH